jgi:hypothetical protein
VTVSRGRWPKVDQDSGIEDAALLILERLGEQGVNAMIKVDAERMLAGESAWTFVASGGPLEQALHADAATVQQCLSWATGTPTAAWPPGSPSVPPRPGVCA